MSVRFRALFTDFFARWTSFAPMDCPTRIATVCPMPRIGVKAMEFNPNAIAVAAPMSFP